MVPMGEVEQSALVRLFRAPRVIKQKGIVCRSGEPVRHYPAILSGWAARCQTMSNGERQITGLLLPGDLAYSSRHATPRALEEIIALSSCRVAFVPQSELHELIAQQPKIADAMQAYAAIEYAISNAWLVSLGSRNAFERIAHLLCELQHRLDQVDAVSLNSFSLPLTQSDFADALGLSPVHVNRKLQALRQGRLIALHSKNIEILDLPYLRASAYFDSSYLNHSPATSRSEH